MYQGNIYFQDNMNFEYLQTIRKEASIDIEQPGNTNLQGFTDDGLVYYLQLYTYLGFTKVKTFGPFKDDKPDTYFCYLTYEVEYNEKKIKKVINDFLNGKTPKTQVFEIESEMIYNILSNLNL